MTKSRERGIRVSIGPSPMLTRIYLDGEDVSRYCTRMVLTADVSDPDQLTRIDLTLVAIDTQTVVEFEGVVREKPQS